MRHADRVAGHASKMKNPNGFLGDGPTLAFEIANCDLKMSPELQISAERSVMESFAVGAHRRERDQTAGSRIGSSRV